MNEFDNVNSTQDENGESVVAQGATDGVVSQNSEFDENGVAVEKDETEEVVFSNVNVDETESFDDLEEADGSSEVVFEEDGTYHSTGNVSTEGTKMHPRYQGGTSQEQGTSYPYGQAPRTNAYNPNMPPHGRPATGAPGQPQGVRPPYGQQPQGGGYPYGQQPQGGRYPYGQQPQGGRSPYGQQPQGTGTPYGQRPPMNGSAGGYPYGNTPNGGGNGFGPASEPYKYAYPGDMPSGKKKKGGMKVFAAIAAALFVFIIIALIAVISGGNNVSVHENETTAALPENIEEFTTSASPETDDVDSVGEMNPKSIYKKVLPSSVGILVYDRSKALASEGTGVLFSESTDGKYTYIITCAHVIRGTTGVIIVQLHDGKKYDANIIGLDNRTDIGVLRIEANGLSLAEIGDSTKVYVGDPVYAIGNPGGVEFANSFTDGIVSALDRPVNSSDTGYTTECIQHTAAINPGNSGGALVNSFGQVVGINSMKIVADEYEGMGFSVPSSVFVEIVNEILKNGYVSNRPKLGITYVPASEYSSYGMFVAIKGLPAGSIIVYEIAADSAFTGTDVRKGDMIVAVNGKGLEEPSYLSKVIEESEVGDKLTLKIVRIFEDYTFEEFEVTVTLVEDKSSSIVEEEDNNSIFPEESQSGSYGNDYFNDFFEDYFNDYFGGRTP